MGTTINTRLKAARVLRGLRQSDLAEKLGRSQSWLCEVERGLIEPSDLDVALICRVLKIRPDSIFNNDSDQEAPNNLDQLTGQAGNRGPP